jgi:protein-L-isoaspartate O-methyltransferase
MSSSKVICAPDGQASMSSSKPGRRRESFEEIADAYSLYRPTPPIEVVDAVIASSDLRQGSSVLEIGCGTGQLSVPLAKHGVDLVAIELGSHLAALARRNLVEFSNARVEVGAFEEWQLPMHKFDAVVSASALMRLSVIALKAAAVLSIISLTWPPSRSAIAGPEPL